MTSTYSSRNRFTRQGTGDNQDTWGSVNNDGVIDLVDQSLDGVLNLDITGTVAHTLTTQNGSDDESRNRMLYITGTPTGDTTITIPAVEKIYAYRTSLGGSSNVIFQATGSPAAVTVASDSRGFIWCDGTDAEELVSRVDGLQVANNLSDLNDAATARTNLGLQGGATTSVEQSAGGLVAYASIDAVTVGMPAVTGELLTSVSVPAATETTAGITRYATTAEATAGLVTTAALTPAHMGPILDSEFNTSVSGESGIMYFPGSVVFQWGMVSAVPYNIPTTVAFPHSFTTLFTGMAVGWQKQAGYDRDTAIDNISTTQIVVRHGAGTAHDIAWQVWGKL